MFGQYFGSCICAVAPLIAGLILKLFPPKEINKLWGFGTRRTMVNQETWVYSHKVCANCLLIYSAITIPILALLLIINPPFIANNLQFVFLYGLAVGLMGVIPTTIIVQIKAKRFSDNLEKQRENDLSNSNEK